MYTRTNQTHEAFSKMCWAAGATRGVASITQYLSVDLPTHTHHPPNQQESIQANFGDFGAAALLTSLQIRLYDEATQVFILRCPRDGYRSAWAAMTLLTALGGGGGGGQGGTKASISVLRVSGSVRTCRKEAVDILVHEAGGEAEVEAGGAEAKRGHYQALVEGAIQGV